ELYIAMTSQTDDAGAQAAYAAFIADVQPRRRELGVALDRKIVTEPHSRELPPQRYAVMLRDLQAKVELFRPENLALERELASLDQDYNQVLGGMLVEFEGESLTITALTGKLELREGERRDAAWRAMQTRWADERERLDALFDRMVLLRHRLGQNAGFADFRDFQHRRLRRFDYHPHDCERFHVGVEQEVVPLLRRLDAQRAAALELESLRPWDLAVDPLGRAPLRPFDSVAQLLERGSRVFHRMGPTLGQMFDSLREGDSLDLDSRPHKAPGGYQYQRQRSRRPFIFMNATGIHRDLVALFHEAGHAFHALLGRDEPLLHYREYPTEFAEFAAMSMELLTLPGLHEFYAPDDAVRARRHYLEEVVRRLAWTAQIDAFQHWLYTHPGHSPEQRERQWIALDERFGPTLNWTGLEPLRGRQWHRQIHIFSAPFYYIEYGIAQIGALQLWARARRDPEAALSDYTHALARAACKPLPELYAAAGVRFAFDREALALVMADLAAELDQVAALSHASM
ncbi:MAG: M3 family oligoendopeptidase, partial [Myxococcales bacterium]|nr:M3 family oligoendopeptidase [Myxococcales bacterium]